MASRPTFAARLPSTLAAAEAPLATFFDATGALAFGKSWPAKPVGLLQRGSSFVRAGSPEAYVRDLHGEVLAACRTGTIETCFSAKVRRKRLGTPPSLLGVNPEISLLCMTPGEPDPIWEAPQMEHFAVKLAFWSDATLIENVDWLTSRAKVPKKYILWDTLQFARVSKASSTVLVRQDDFEIPEIFDCVLKVRDPARAAQHFLSQIIVPSDDWARRYRIHRSSFMKELLICGWKYLAITQPKPEHGLIIQIEREMRDYLKREGFSEENADGLEMKATLNNLASNLYKQWCEKTLGESVLVNSKRASRKSSRAAPPKQKPNKPT